MDPFPPGVGNSSLCDTVANTPVGAGMLPSFPSLRTKFLPLILPLLRVGLNTSWKPTPVELKAETMRFKLKTAAGWAQGPDPLRAPLECFQAFLQFCSPGMMKNMCLPRVRDLRTGSV